MEVFSFTVDEFRLLRRFKKRLQKKYQAAIILPNRVNIRTTAIFVDILGTEQSRVNIKNFIKTKAEKMQENTGMKLDNTSMKQKNTGMKRGNNFMKQQNNDNKQKTDMKQENAVDTCNDVIVIDSDSENDVIDLDSDPEINVHLISSESTSVPKLINLKQDLPSTNTAVNSTTNFATLTNFPVPSTSKTNTPNPSVQLLPDFIPLNVFPHSSPPCKKRKIRSRYYVKNSTLNDSIKIVYDNCPSNEKDNTEIDKNTETEDIVCLDDHSVANLRVIVPSLKKRPIIIDGSNVARLHGKSTNSFSCKGIKISVDYFIKRGHTEVIAFVPQFRIHCDRGPVITTNPEILLELEKNKHLVMTPSRKINRKRITCYDDRFILEYASQNGGVVLSNDHFKDLINASDAFRETIENRVLMFLFIQDTLMIPSDPLGRTGPDINTFLCFPPETQQNATSVK